MEEKKIETNLVNYKGKMIESEAIAKTRFTKGKSGNPRGRLATLKPFATALQAALDTCIPDENGIPVSRMEKIVMNLIKIASDPNPQRADSAVRAILLLADRIDGKAAPSVEALENSGIRVVTVNNVAITPPRPEPVKILQPTFVQTNEKDGDAG
jgi:hypothetical protein